MTTKTKPAKFKPGLWDVSSDAYHAFHEAYGKSMLDDYECPGYFHGRYVTRTIAADEPTPDMVLGSLTHVATLQPEIYDCHYFVTPQCAPDGTPWDRRKKDHKSAWDEIKRDLRTPVDFYDDVKIRAMVESIKANPQAAKLLINDHPAEMGIRWYDEATKLPLKCLCDKIVGKSLIVDLKTCHDASPRAFAKSVADFGYHRQAAHYIDGFEQAFGMTPQAFIFVAVCKTEPYPVAVYTLDDDAIELGRSQLRSTKHALAESLKTGIWTAPYERIINRVSLPRWAYSDQWELS